MSCSGIGFTIIFPILEIMSFYLAIGLDLKDLKIGVVNEETRFNSCAAFNDDSNVISYYNFSSCEMTGLSCKFLRQIEGPLMKQVS